MTGTRTRAAVLITTAGMMMQWSLFSRALAQCQPLEQTHKLLAQDGTDGDFLGHSVALASTLHGDVAIVGAHLHDNPARDGGTVYVFDVATGQQIAVMNAPDGQPFDYFGYAVAAVNNLAIIGAIRESSNGPQAGAAYLYDMTDPEHPSLRFKITPDDPADQQQFGFAVAIAGEETAQRIIVGAPNDSQNGFRAGAAYLFDASSGAQLHKLLPNDPAQDDNFGMAVDLTSDAAIVGAGNKSDHGIGSGAAYIFDNASGRQLLKLRPPDNQERDYFGFSVAINGTRNDAKAIIGAPGSDWHREDGGVVYVYDLATRQYRAKLIPTTGHRRFSQFGMALAMSGPPDNQMGIIGEFRYGEHVYQAGAAFLFELNEYHQIAMLLADDPRMNQWLGYSVAVSGTPDHATVLAGAMQDNENGVNAGAAYLYQNTETAPRLVQHGLCPGRLTLTVTGNDPGARVALLYASQSGTFQIPARFACSGTALCLDRTVQLIQFANADTSGKAEFHVRVQPPHCGNGLIQTLDLASCRVSNTLQVN